MTAEHLPSTPPGAEGAEGCGVRLVESGRGPMTGTDDGDR